MRYTPRPMARRLFTLASAVSLLLCVTVCVLWVRSHVAAVRSWPAVHLSVGTEGRTQWVLNVHLGRLSFGRHRWDDPALGGRPGPNWQRGRWGFYASRSYWVDPRGPRYGSMRHLTTPCWAAALSLAALPALRAYGVVRNWRARRLRRRGHCPRCGYDLRASPDRCPECGTVPSLRRPAAV